MRFSALVAAHIVLVASFWAQTPPAGADINASGSASGTVPVQTNSDSKKLEPIRTVKALYPADAKSARIEGTVVVKVQINETGVVDGTEVVSGNPVLAASCADALKQWAFKPFVRDGRPIRVSASLPCNFSLGSDLTLVPIEDRSSRSSRSSEEKVSNNAPPTPGSGVPPAGQDSIALVLVKKKEASYPFEAENGQIQGEVVVDLLVGESGDVTQTKIVSGNPILAKAVLDAVKKWKFEPFIRSGKGVQASTRVSYDFAFKDKIIMDRPYQPPAPVEQQSNATTGTPENHSSPQRVRVSAGVTQGLIIYKVQPVYPPAARLARIQGTVVLAAVIGKDGRIKDLHVLSDPHELVDAAVGAVQQWRYRPYVLLGNPVEVDTQITVKFQLSRF